MYGTEVSPSLISAVTDAVSEEVKVWQARRLIHCIRSCIWTAFTVAAALKLITWGCGGNLRLIYAVSPRLARYSSGLSEPREILMRFSLYQRM